MPVTISRSANIDAHAQLQVLMQIMQEMKASQEKMAASREGIKAEMREMNTGQEVKTEFKTGHE